MGYPLSIKCGTLEGIVPSGRNIEAFHDLKMMRDSWKNRIRHNFSKRHGIFEMFAPSCEASFTYCCEAL